MSHLRRLSTRSLVVLVVAVLALAGGGAALAVATRGTGPTPPPKPLDQAIHDALAAPALDGITARIAFTNRLFPSGALLGQVGSALMSGATGRLWATNDGRGRIELQSDVGDVQVVWTRTRLSVYDASSNTVYRADLPAHRATGADHGAPPALAEIDRFLGDLGARWTVSAAQPTGVAGRAAYGVSIAPKHDGGLLGSLELAWDAAQGVPLRAAIYAQGSSAPVLELTATDISYGAVPAADVDVAPPAGAKVVALATGAHGGDHGAKTPAVTGLDAVKAAAGFPVVAPDSLVGLPRRDVRLVGGHTVLVLYGQGLGGLALVERSTDASGSTQGGIATGLPTVSLDGVSAHELATQLGTVLTWDAGGTSYVLAGSLPPAAAEAAARSVR